MVKFKAAFGGVDKQVELHEPNGVGQQMYYVMIDGFYCGRIWKTEYFGWQNDIHPSLNLSMGDIQILIDMIKV